MPFKSSKLASILRVEGLVVTPARLQVERVAAQGDFFAVWREVRERLVSAVAVRIRESGLDIRVAVSGASGTIFVGGDEIRMEPFQGQGQYQVVLEPLVGRRVEVLARGSDARQLAMKASKVYLTKHLEPRMVEIEERLAQKAREEGARREQERVKRDEAQAQEELGTWSVARTGYEVGGDAEEEFQGYVAEVETFDSKQKAIDYAKEIGGATVVRGTQMWNEPVGQVEERGGVAWTRFYR